jgi:hypothetical protein
MWLYGRVLPSEVADGHDLCVDFERCLPAGVPTLSAWDAQRALTSWTALLLGDVKHAYRKHTLLLASSTWIALPMFKCYRSPVTNHDEGGPVKWLTSFTNV